MKKIKNFQKFLESAESEPEGEVAITFPNSITIGNKIYKDTDELEKDYKINSMSQSGNQITINGQALQDWVNSMNGMETEEEEDY